MNNRVAEFSLSKSFEMTWLMIFYIIGVYLRRTNLDALKINYLMLTYVLSLVATYTMTFMVGNIWYW
ncbi:hypothetical protein ScFU97_15950 [Streptococcus canis]|nr:hypothetical protein ScFU97_15950 [Streptococcus canis]